LRMKLSLKADKNWHQNSGANRRDVIKVRNMTAGVLRRCSDRMGRRNVAARQAGKGIPARRSFVRARFYCST
jgi:hypothetical protein